MPNTAKKLTLYDDLLALPDHVVGEIIGGQLHVQPRPTGKHTLAHSELIVELGGPFDRGRGGPGGWWILTEPEIHFIRDNRALKLPLYARFGVAHAWLVDPAARTLEAFELREGLWSLVGVFKDEDTVATPPFAAVPFGLAVLWG